MEDEFPPLPNANNGIQPAISGQEKNISTAVKNKEIQQADIQMNKRSRSSPSGSTNKRKQATLSDYWLAAPDTNRSNRFDILSEDGDDEVSAEYTLPAVKPPPIYVSMVENVQPLINLLNSVAKDEFEIKIIKNIEVKIQPKTEIAYSNITKALIEKNTQFHTFKLKSERPFNVVIKGLHQSTPINEIKEELESSGYEVINVSNVKHRITKNPLSMFYVNLKQNVKNKDIYKIQHLLYTKIIVEPPKKKREIPQCHKCQRYGHTQKMCNHTPRCVKCAGSHSTTECLRKEKSQDVKCVLCDGNHPANYKGCMVYKDLQQKTFPTLRRKTPNTQTPLTNVNPAISYAQSVSQPVQHGSVKTQPGPSNTPPENQSNDISELKSMLMMLLQQMNTMFNVLNTVLSKMSK